MDSVRWGRPVGLLFAAVSLAGTFIWFVTGAAVPVDVFTADTADWGTDTRYITVYTPGKQPDADRIAARLRSLGYASTDDEHGLPDWYGHDVILDRPFTQKEAAATAVKFGHDFPGADVSFAPRARVAFGSAIRHGRVPFSYLVFVGFLALFSGVLRAGMLSASAEVITAGALAMWLLLRPRQSPESRLLGFGLACFSLYAFFLTLYSVATVFSAWQPPSWPLRIALDVFAAELVVVGFYAFTKFWAMFPRAVAQGELDAFLQARQARQMRRFWTRRSAGRTRTASDSTRLAITAVLGLFAGLVWTGGFMLPGFWPLVVIQFVFGIFLLVMLYSQGLTCLRLFSYHLANGSEDDRRKIEWVWASLWIAFLVLLVPLIALACLNLGGLFFAGLDDWSRYALATELVAMSVAPTLVFIAIGLSIQYRGTVDPKLALRGFTIWTLLSVVLTLIFVLVERAVALKLVGWWHLPPQTGLVTAGAIVAATFQPIRRRLERHVNRFVERVLPTTLLASGVRHLRAVAVVDISGHASLTAKDEQGALLTTALLQKEARLLAEQGGGRLVKATGDGVILCFEDPQKALTCVTGLHRVTRAGAVTLNLPEVRLHSGLHWGEIIEMRDGDIYGMTVNLATRLADWARSGEIGVSNVFRDSLQSATPGFVDAGVQSFKNVPESVPCFRLEDV